MFIVKASQEYFYSGKPTLQEFEILKIQVVTYTFLYDMFFYYFYMTFLSDFGTIGSSLSRFLRHYFYCDLLRKCKFSAFIIIIFYCNIFCNLFRTQPTKDVLRIGRFPYIQ